MYNTVDYEELIEEDNIIFVDVRSESEYRKETIKGAINIPILTDSERADVGTIYVQKSTEEAKVKGIEYISKRLPNVFSKFQELFLEDRKRKLVIFCARGGMRSGSIHALLNSLGIKVYKLKGGYKAYRNYIFTHFESITKDSKFIVIHGKTGVGKTKLLEKLEEKGYPVINLEKAANHRGSLLGSVDLGEQNSQKSFEDMIFHKMNQDKANLYFIEGESKRIGKIIIPEFFWKKMKNGYSVFIDNDYEYRSEILIDEYLKNENSKIDLIKSLDNLKRYINSERIEKYKEKVLNEQYKEVAIDLMKKYYDPLYINSMKNETFYSTIENEDFNNTLNSLIKIYEEILKEA